MKKTCFSAVLMMVILTASLAGAVIEKEVDSFDGSITYTSLTKLLTSYKQNAIAVISVFSLSPSGYKVFGIAYFSDHGYLFSHLPLELKIDGSTIVEADYLTQESEYYTFYPVAKVATIGMYDFSGDVSQQLMAATTVTFRAHSDVGGIVYDVPPAMLAEWKVVLGAFSIPA